MTLVKQLKKIKKLNTLRHIPEKIIINEINQIKDNSKMTNTLERFNPHIVLHNGNKYLAYDLPLLNKYANQKRRGEYRALFQNYNFIALALHKKKGGYKII